jgi:hypothetical protein
MSNTIRWSLMNAAAAARPPSESDEMPVVPPGSEAETDGDHARAWGVVIGALLGATFVLNRIHLTLDVAAVGRATRWDGA